MERQAAQALTVTANLSVFTTLTLALCSLCLWGCHIIRGKLGVFHCVASAENKETHLNIPCRQEAGMIGR